LHIGPSWFPEFVITPAARLAAVPETGFRSEFSPSAVSGILERASMIGRTKIDTVTST
jgi:hypothetical protein